jgi:hypothetical protein
LAARPGDERPSAERNQGFRLGINDRLLLCTDGLTDVLEVTEITEVMLDAPLEVAASKLVQLALGRGAPDNLTAVAIGFPKGQPYKGRAISNWKRLALILLLALILGVVAWVRWPTLGEDFTKPLTPEATAITTNTPLPTHTSTVLPE